MVWQQQHSLDLERSDGPEKSSALMESTSDRDRFLLEPGSDREEWSERKFEFWIRWWHRLHLAEEAGAAGLGMNERGQKGVKNFGLTWGSHATWTLWSRWSWSCCLETIRWAKQAPATAKLLEKQEQGINSLLWSMEVGYTIRAKINEILIIFVLRGCNLWKFLTSSLFLLTPAMTRTGQHFGAARSKEQIVKIRINRSRCVGTKNHPSQWFGTI